MKSKQQTIRMLEKRLDNNVRRGESFGKKTKTRKLFMRRAEEARRELRRVSGI